MAVQEISSSSQQQLYQLLNQICRTTSEKERNTAIEEVTELALAGNKEAVDNLRCILLNYLPDKSNYKVAKSYWFLIKNGVEDLTYVKRSHMHLAHLIDQFVTQAMDQKETACGAISAVTALKEMALKGFSNSEVALAGLSVRAREAIRERAKNALDEVDAERNL